jgi:hypothetical protein
MALPHDRRLWPDFESLTANEKAEALRADSYATHKARGTLGTHYQLYPDDRPISQQRASGRDEERER